MAYKRYIKCNLETIMEAMQELLQTLTQALFDADQLQWWNCCRRVWNCSSSLCRRVVAIKLSFFATGEEGRRPDELTKACDILGSSHAPRAFLGLALLTPFSIRIGCRTVSLSLTKLFILSRFTLCTTGAVGAGRYGQPRENVPCGTFYCGIYCSK